MRKLLVPVCLLLSFQVHSQSFTYARDLGFQSSDLQTAVAADGSIFLSGTAMSGVDMNPDPLQIHPLEGFPGKKAGFVSKFSPAGHFVWSISLADASSDITIPFTGGDALKIGQNGRLHAAFVSQTPMKYFPGGINAKGLCGNGGYAIVTLNPDGSLMSVFDVYNSQNSSPFLPMQFNDFVPLDNGKVAVVGAFRGLIHGGVINQALYNNGSALNGFAFVFNPADLNQIRGVSVGSDNSDQIFTGIGQGLSGRLIIGGNTYGNFDANPSLTAQNWVYLSFQAYDSFFIVLDSSFQYISAEGLYTVSDIRHQIESSPGNKWSVFNGIYPHVFNPSGVFKGYLSPVETVPDNSSLQIRASKMVLDDAGSVYCLGGMRDTVGGIPKIRMNMLKQDFQGEVLWQTSIRGATMNFEGTSVGVSPDGSSIVAVGYFDGKTDFDPSAAQWISEVPIGQKRAFLLKFSDPCPDLRATYLQNTPVSCDSAGVVRISGTGGQPPYSYSWQVGGNVIQDSVFRPAAGGYYPLSVSDATGCERRVQVFVDQPTSLDQSLTDMSTYAFVNDDFRPGFDRTIVALASNAYCQKQDGALTLILDPQLEWLYSDPLPDLITGDTLAWYFDDLESGVTFQTRTAVKLPATAILGDTVCLTSVVTPADASPENNHFTAKEIVIGSFDPNDITAWPSGVCEENAILPDNRLIYRVRFQNTGTASAINVVILDTLPTGLNLSTLQLLGYSHPVGIERRDSNTLAFVFDNINLPDSTSDEAGSHGYLLFGISQKPGLPDGFKLNNKAAIFFDFNEPVITNNEMRTVVSELPDCFVESGVHQSVTEIAGLEVSPNPLPDGNPLVIQLEGENGENADLEIRTIDGKLYYRGIMGQSAIIPASALPDFTFLVRVSRGRARATRTIIRQ